MEHAQVLALIGHGLARIVDLGPTLGTGAVMVATAVFSSVTDNIPLAAMLAKIIAGMPVDGMVRPPTDPLWWAVIFGTNLGGNITPIGSASTLVAVTIIHKHGLHLSFGAFVTKALPFALAQISIAAVYVLWVL
jgi:Na+/H+ antiporter NhaD/arsenite permease-like protein